MAQYSPAGDSDPDLSVRVLGPLELAAGPAGVEPMPVRLRRLFAGLVVSAGSVVSADRLADIVWAREAAAPDNADAALQNLVSRLRSRLRAVPGPIEIRHRPPGYLLALDSRRLDAVRFAELAAAGQRTVATTPQQAADLLDEALALWRGPAYAEFVDEDFAGPEAARLEELRRCALEDRAEAALRLGRHFEVTALLESFTRTDPLRERPHRQLVLAHYRAGRQADALAVARAHRERLAEELGIDPSPEMARLETDILRQDAALAWQPPAGGEDRPTGPPIAHPASAGTDGPQPRQSLLGRESDLPAVRDLVAPGHLVTLTGPGGVGKTTLAQRVSVDLAGQFPDGTATAELASLSAPADVAPAVMTVLGVPPRQEVGPIERLVENLRSRRLLLVLDNCEHVVEAAAALADAVTGSCPGVALLATSRCPLEVRREQVWAVPPLSLPPVSAADPRTVQQAPSVQLFTERATARSRTFVLDEGNAADVAEVCRRLDGLPLAIELAAARMASLSVSELKERLTWRFRLLHGGVRTAAGRHRTLRAVVDWSYDLLDEPSRRAFEALSVFASSFPLEAAEELLDALFTVPDLGETDPPEGGGPDGDVASLVLSLVDRSMLTVARLGQHTRYVLLETLRAYGRERLEARGWGDQVRRAHAELYARMVEEAGSHLFAPGHVAAVQRIHASLDELRAAVAWATEHDLAVAVRLVGGLGIYVEHRIPAEVPQWAERVLDAAGRTAVPGLAQVHAVAAAGARFAGNLELSRDLAVAGLELVQDPATEAYLHFLLSEVALFSGRLDEVLALIDQVAAMTPPAPMAPIVALMGPLALLYRGEPDAARRWASDLRAEARRNGEEVTMAWATYVQGEVLLDVDPAEAIELLTDALAAARRIEDRYLTGVALTAAASVRSRYGNGQEAAALFCDALEHWRQAGDWTHQWTTLRNVVDLLVRLGRYEPAAVLHGALVAREDQAPTYGADAARMRQAAAELESRIGGELAARLCGRGRRLTDAEVVRAAMAYLDGTTAGVATAR